MVSSGPKRKDHSMVNERLIYRNEQNCDRLHTKRYQCCQPCWSEGLALTHKSLEIDSVMSNKETDFGSYDEDNHTKQS